MSVFVKLLLRIVEEFHSKHNFVIENNCSVYFAY